jgi:hypothetical protein
MTSARAASIQTDRAALALRRPSPLLQHTCACGGTPGPDGACALCKAKRQDLQRQGAAPAGPPLVPPAIHAAQRPGHQFGQVRVHTPAAPASQANSRAGGDATAAETTLTKAAAKYNSIKLTFDPATGSPPPRCDRILFVQMIQHTADGTSLLPGTYWKGYQCRDVTALSSGHYIDHGDCAWTTPYAVDYGVGHSSNADKTLPGAASDDTVNTGGGDKGFYSAANPNGWRKVVFHFESYAFCAAGRQCGTWYDGVAWDYTKTDADQANFNVGGVAVTGTLAPPQPGATVIEAFAKYNSAKGFTPCPKK